MDGLLVCNLYVWIACMKPICMDYLYGNYKYVTLVGKFS